ncbi:MAG TPA: carbohydrate binding domain-containing protein, partial [Bacilli bacterium]
MDYNIRIVKLGAIKKSWTIVLGSLFLLLLLLSFSQSPVYAVPPGWTIVWQDEFNGTALDRSKWDPYYPDATSDFIHSSSSFAYHTQNASVSDGTLKIKIEKNPVTIGDKTVQYRTGSVTSKYVPYVYKYGYIEASIKMASTPNLNNAFWLLPSEGFLKFTGNGNEVDIVEYYTADSIGQYSNGMYWGSYWGALYTENAFVNAPGIKTGFHKFGFESNGQIVKFYYDDVLVRTYFGEGVPQGFHDLVFSVSGSNFDDATLPANMEVDYVRVYTKDGTTPEQLPQPDYSNKVINPGFESEDQTGWTGWGSWSVVNSNAYSGSISAQVPPNAAAEQVVTGLQPNRTYTLKAWVKTANSTNTAYLGVKEYDLFKTGEDTNVSTNSTAYRQLSVNFKTGIYDTSARIYLYVPGSASGYTYGDSFEVVKDQENYALDAPATASSSADNFLYAPFNAVDGQATGVDTTKWSSVLGQETSWLQVDLRQVRDIRRYVVQHAGVRENWGTQSINTKDFKFQVSSDGTVWQDADAVTGNTASITNRTVTPVNARYARLYITNPQTETTNRAARIYEFQVFGPPLPPPPAPLITIQNPGFETGNATGWTGYGDWTATNLSPNTGNYSVRVGPGGGTEQVINNLNSNTTYILKAWTRSQQGYPLYLGVKDFGGLEVGGENKSNLYSPTSIEFTTGSTNTSVKIYLYRPATVSGSTPSTVTGSAFADDFTLSAAPAPLPNKVTNPGFESGSTTGWQGYGAWRVVNGSAHSGSYSAEVNPGGAAEQTITGLTQNTVYTL